MAFERPTLSELVDRVQADLVSRLGLSSPVLRRSVVYVLARVIAAAVHMLYGTLSYLSRQVFPDLSDEEYLVRQAALFGTDRTEADYAQGDVVFTGTNGTNIPAGTAVVRADGYRYTTDALVTIAVGTATAAVTSDSAAANANASSGTTLTLESPISGINSTSTVDSGGLTSGADQETVSALRTRLLERMQSPPHGGTAADYIAWAKEVSGVTRAWCYPLEDGPGTVTVRFVRDGDASLIPDSGEVSDVQDYIDAVRPVTADVTVEAPVAVPLAMTIEVTPDTATIRAAVEAEIEDMLLAYAEPGGTILLSQIEVAVGTASGVTDFDVTVPAADVTHATGEIATLGTITWV